MEHRELEERTDTDGGDEEVEDLFCTICRRSMGGQTWRPIPPDQGRGCDSPRGSLVQRCEQGVAQHRNQVRHDDELLRALDPHDEETRQDAKDGRPDRERHQQDAGHERCRAQGLEVERLVIREGDERERVQETAEEESGARANAEQPRRDDGRPFRLEFDANGQAEEDYADDEAGDRLRRRPTRLSRGESDEQDDKSRDEKAQSGEIEIRQQER